MAVRDGNDTTRLVGVFVLLVPMAQSYCHAGVLSLLMERREEAGKRNPVQYDGLTCMRMFVDIIVCRLKRYWWCILFPFVADWQ